MLKATITRLYLKRVTLGTFSIVNELEQTSFHATSMELPWHSNSVRISCIPEGEYYCQRDNTGKHKFYKVLDVKNRTHIEIHPASSVNHLQGCISLCEEYDTFKNDPSLNSDLMLDKLLEFTADEPFLLEIKS